MTLITGKSGLGLGLTLSSSSSSPSCIEYFIQQPTSCNESGLDYQTLADDLLYAEIETHRVSYKVAAMNQDLTSPERFTIVTTFSNTPRCRITYIPALLLAVMICVFFTAVATVASVFHSRTPITGRKFRHVDSLRLLLDYALNNLDEQLTALARSWNNDELQSWATKHMVKYEGHQEPSGKPSTLDHVRL